MENNLQMQNTKNNNIVTPAIIETMEPVETILTELELGIENPLNEIFINSHTNVATELAKKENANKPQLSFEELVPWQLHKYKDVFNPEMAKRFPESRPWDHPIDLKDDFVPTDCKVYPLTLPEQDEMNKFIDENLAKEYIRPSTSPMASPFFFVDKKDRKLGPCRIIENSMKELFGMHILFH